MRNLRNIKHAKYKLSEGSNAALTGATWDASDDSLILAFGPTEESPAISLRRLKNDANGITDALPIASWDAPSPKPDLRVDRVVDIHCFPDTKYVVLILQGGDIVVVREDPQESEDLIEIVGSIDAGISAAVWSPDEELVTICTNANTLLFMTRDFDSMADITLTAEDLKVSNHVSVGWGRKETQFKGRGAARTLRDPTMPEHVDEGTVSELDDCQASISWRGDGQFVAVSSILDVNPKRRVIRVYSREGILQSVSEPVDGLEQALSWKPSGQVIAAIQRQNEVIKVVFFERNGLRHGEFCLRLDPGLMATVGKVINLTWNNDSSVLAVSFSDRVQLWTTGNYHYYLKQEIVFNNTAAPNLATTVWHPEKPLQVACGTRYDLRRLQYQLEVSRGSVNHPHDDGLVAVIDGKKLKITPLRIANVPPPMAFDEVDLPQNALDVSIREDGCQIAVLHQTSVSILKCDYTSKPPRLATVENTIAISEEGEERNSRLQLLEGRLEHHRTDHDRIRYAHTDGTLTNGHAFTESHLPHNDDIAEWHSSSGDPLSFQLKNGGTLHISSNSDITRIAGCTSFVVTKAHLIYTTSQHFLKFVHLHTGKLDIPADEPEKDERCRSIERGARIVTVMPSTYSLVLQMPRGNLETIYPRALVLSGVRASVRCRDYKKAFLTCRTHRVDMNILHDYAPHQFLEDVDLFLKQVKKVEHIDLFLSSLSEDDVSTTMYRDTLAPTEKAHIDGHGVATANGVATKAVNGIPNSLPRSMVNGAAHVTSPESDSKMNRICDAFLAAMQQDQQARLQNIVTAHVCKNPPDLEAGVRLVSKLRKQASQDQLEQAVEHICFLADVNQLYDTALGVYDLDVALLVAQQSQKDPREYLPYLQELHDMQPLDRQFQIDDDLKRYEKAIRHLYAQQDFERVKLFAAKHEMYATAIDLYRYDNARLNDLMRMYGDYLHSRNKFKEAAIAYEYIADHAAAYEAYRAVSMWRECLANAFLVPLAHDELSSLAQDLAASLEEVKDYMSAATIRLDYLEDLEGSARLLCKGYRFAEAIRQVTLRHRSELLTSVIDTGLVEGSATMTELLAEMKSQLAAQVPRLRELRQKKEEDPMAFLDGADGGEGDIPDNISLAPTDATTSGGTFMTRYTNRSMGTLATNATRKTSKNRRREERKRARGKKGTVYEEEYLVNSISRLIQRMNDVAEDVKNLVEGLMRRAQRERAIAVQAAMDDLNQAVRLCMDEVFTASKPGSEQRQDGDSTIDATQSRPWGGEGVLWDAMTSQVQAAPMLRPFEKLALLP